MRGNPEAYLVQIVRSTELGILAAAVGADEVLTSLNRWVVALLLLVLVDAYRLLRKPAFDIASLLHWLDRPSRRLTQ